MTTEIKTSKHTPTPYYTARNGEGWFLCANGADGQVEVATVHNQAEYADCLPAEDNAAFIVLAVNHHDRLVEALRKTIREYEADYADLTDGEYGVPDGPGVEAARTLLREIEEVSRG